MTEYELTDLLHPYALIILIKVQKRETIHAEKQKIWKKGIWKNSSIRKDKSKWWYLLTVLFNKSSVEYPCERSKVHSPKSQDKYETS